MTKANKLLKKLDNWVEGIAGNDFHFIPGIMITCAQEGRINGLRKKERLINRYFNYSPDVYEIVKKYKPCRLIKFLERIK